jgi:hypothetical protein
MTDAASKAKIYTIQQITNQLESGIPDEQMLVMLYSGLASAELNTPTENQGQSDFNYLISEIPKLHRYLFEIIYRPGLLQGRDIDDNAQWRTVVESRIEQLNVRLGKEVYERYMKESGNIGVTLI